MRSLKILGLMLSYPSDDLKQVLPECLSILRTENMLPATGIEDIEQFAHWLSQTDMLDAQEDYVALFDRTPSLSLHLFEHVHGDSRERGQAMVELSEAYKEKGLELLAHELPDYLPAFLEYLSILPTEQAVQDIGSVVSILAAIQERLLLRETVYANIFAALVALSDKKPIQKLVQQNIEKASGALPDMQEVDKTWEEQFAFATPGPNASAACPQASAMIQRMYETRKAAS